MKKLILISLASLFACVSVMAQDMAEATEIYNNGAMSLNMGDNASALSQFKSALAMAEACGEEGEELVANCKGIIPQIMLSQGKEIAKAGQHDEAIAKLNETIAVAQEYGNAEVEASASELIPQLRVQKANSLLQAKNYEAAVSAYEDVIADNPNNGKMYVRLGQAQTASGKTAEAIETYKTAYELGEVNDASKQLSTLYVKNAQASLKAQKYQDAIDACELSNSYKENSNAYKIAASAATKLNKTADAISYHEKYLAVTPNAKDEADINYTIAVLSQQSGDKAKAKEYYQKLVSDPKYGEAAKAQVSAL